MKASIWRRLSAATVDFFVVPTIALIIMLISGALENAEAWSNGFPWVRVLLLGVTAYLLVNGVLLGDTAKHWANGFARSRSLTTIQVSNRLLETDSSARALLSLVAFITHRPLVSARD